MVHQGIRVLATVIASVMAVATGVSSGHRAAPSPTARPFTVHVPPSYSPTVAAPLLVMLHGYGSSGSAEESYLDLTAAADAHGMLYVHPDGTVDTMGERFWNATDACCDLYGSGVDDSAYLSGVITRIEARYRIDRRRVFVVGHSNGAFMAYRMACDHADQVAAVVSLEGAAFADATRCRPSVPVATLEIHGTADAVVAYAGGTMQGSAYPSAQRTAAAWARLDGCTSRVDDPAPAPHAIALGLPAATVTAHSTGCRANGHVELWTEPGGHHIPKLTAAFAEEIVRYLLAHPKPAGARPA